MNILITGGAGYIGSLLTLDLDSLGHNVTVYDNLLYNHGNLIHSSWIRNYWDETLNFYNQDLAKIEDWSFIKEFDVVVHLAAIVGAPACDKNTERATEVNLELTKMIVDNLRDDQVLIFPNTNSSYGSVPEGICTEETPLNAISLYAQTKDDAERYILKNHKKSVIFRLATVFGCSPRTRVDLLVNTLVYEAYFNKKIDIFDGGLRRNYVHVQDVVNAICWSIQNSKMLDEVYNLGLDTANMTKLELATLIGQELDVPVHVSEGHDPDRRDYLVSSEKLKRIGFAPRISLKTGVKELVDFYKMLPKDSRERQKILRYHRNDNYEDPL